jgi:hypothetical protein
MKAVEDARYLGEASKGRIGELHKGMGDSGRRARQSEGQAKRRRRSILALLAFRAAQVSAEGLASPKHTLVTVPFWPL